MSRLTLGVHGLSAAEAGLVRALLSLADPAVTARWSFALTGPCDMLLADAAAGDGHEAGARRGASELVLVGAAPTPDRSSLARPIRAEQLVACLRTFADRTADLPGARAPDLRATSIEPPAEVSPDAAGHRRYRLLRWPPTELLRTEPLRVRMASQLSRRFLSAADLAQLTNTQIARVQTFLQLLHGFGLLQPEPQMAAAAPVSLAPQAPAARGTPGWGLVQSIRRRLGL